MYNFLNERDLEGLHYFRSVNMAAGSFPDGMYFMVARLSVSIFCIYLTSRELLNLSGGYHEKCNASVLFPEALTTTDFRFDCH